MADKPTVQTVTAQAQNNAFQVNKATDQLAEAIVPLMPKDGSEAMTGTLDMNGYKVENVDEPTNLTDVATKRYVDSTTEGADQAAYESALEAKGYRDEAEVFRDDAEASAAEAAATITNTNTYPTTEVGAVTRSGATFTKSTGTDIWDVDGFYSNKAYSRGCTLSYYTKSATEVVRVGLSSSQTIARSSLDWSSRHEGTLLYIFNGTTSVLGSPFTVGATDLIETIYNNREIIFKAGGTTLYSETIDSNLSFYASATFKEVGSGLTNVEWLPYTSLNEVPTLDQFGDAGSGDWSAILQDAFDSTDTLLIPPRETPYICNSSITKSGNMTIYMDGATVDGSAVASGNAVFDISGSLTALPATTGNPNENDTAIPFASDPGLDENDTFMFFNPTSSSWSGHRAEFKAGEFCKVHTVSGNTANIFGRLYDSYTSASADMYKMAECKVKVVGGTIVEPSTGSIVGLRVLYGTEVDIDGLGAYGSNYAAVSLISCYNVSVTPGEMVNNEPASGTQYGLVIANCQTVSIQGSSLFATRHSIAIGGGSQVGCVPNRDIKINNMTLNNYDPSGVASSDMHGNVEDVHYSNCVINGPALMAGKNVSYSDCKIFFASASGVCVFASEILGGVFELKNCTLYTAATATSRGMVFAVTDANTVEDVTIKVIGCTFVSKVSQSGQSVVRVGNSGSSANINVYIGGGTTIDPKSTAFDNVLRLNLTSGTANTQFLIVDGIAATTTIANLLYPDGNYSVTARQRLQSGFWS